MRLPVVLGIRGVALVVLGEQHFVCRFLGSGGSRSKAQWLRVLGKRVVLSRHWAQGHGAHRLVSGLCRKCFQGGWSYC